MDNKKIFRKSILSSAILAVILECTASVANTCPQPNHLNTIQLDSGSLCEGSIVIEVNQPPVNNVELKGGVAGDVINHGFVRRFLLAGDEASVGGDVINTNTGYIEEGFALTEESVVQGSILNGGLLGSGIQLIQGAVANNDLVNKGRIFVDPESVYHHLGSDSSTAAIRVDGAGVLQTVRNEGDLLIDFTSLLQEEAENRRSLSGITVENTGFVGDIINTGFIGTTANLPHNAPPFITGFQANGIQVVNGSRSGNITNAGDITVDTYGIYVSGKTAETIVGSIVNQAEGNIVSGDNGIYVSDASLAGDIRNEGLVFSINDNAIDIESGHIDGSVINTGRLVTNIDYDVIDIDDSVITGDVANTDSGVLTGEDGIDIDDSDVQGSVINAGRIKADDEGVDFDQVSIGGDFINSGKITAGRVGISAEGDAEESIIDYTHLAGRFIHNGEIVSGSTGIDLEYVDIGGDFISSGLIQAGAQDAIRDGGPSYHHGINLNEVTIGGSVTLGEINSSGYGAHINDVVIGQQVASVGDITSIRGDAIYLGSGAIGGDFVNSGVLNAGREGLDFESVSVDGHFSNSGGIGSYGAGINLSGITIAGDFINSGAIQSETDSTIKITDEGRIEGSLINTGELVANEHGLLLAGEIDFNNGQPVVESVISIGGGLENRGQITAGNSGLWLLGTEIASDFINRGDITAENHGIGLHYSALGANILNYAVISAEEGDAINIYTSTVAGNIENFGVLNVADDDAGDGISIEESLVKGSVINAGIMNVNGVEGIDIEDSVIEGHVLNTQEGKINADSDGFYINKTHVKGDVINQGSIVAKKHDGIDINAWTMPEDIEAVGISRVDGRVVNTGSIVAGDNGFELEGKLVGHYEQMENPTINRLIIGGEIYNSGDILANDRGFDIDLVTAGDSFENHGKITAGVNAISVWSSSFAGDFINTGELVIKESSEYEEGESRGISFLGKSYEAVSEAPIRSVVTNDFINTGKIAVEGEGIYLANSDIGGAFQNAGNVSSLLTDGIVFNDVTAERGFINTGTVSSEKGAAIRAAGLVTGRFYNSGILNGGVVTLPAEPEEPIPTTLRDIAEGDSVAVDYRAVTSSLDLINTGIINGDIYGSEQVSDRLELAGGQVNGDIYDTEVIDITGSTRFASNIFSNNNSSQLRVTSTGSMAVGDQGALEIQGEYLQEGRLRVELDQNQSNFSESRINVVTSPDTEGEALATATLDSGSQIVLSVKDRNINNFNPGDGNAYDIDLIYADSGITNNGVDITSDSVLFNYEALTLSDNKMFAVRGAVADLGEVVESGGGDVNALNAMAALQGTDSQGLVQLFNTNPTLYNAIYEASAEQLAILAAELTVSPESGVVAGQAAQAEAASTMLNRIAELRTGASGISAGGDEQFFRPDSLWLRAIYADGKQDKSHHEGRNYNGYALRSHGFSLGLDKDINDVLTLGAGVSVINSVANDQGGNNQLRPTDSKTDTYLAAFYGGWRNQGYFVDLSVNAGVSENKLEGASFEASYRSTQFGLGLIGGKSFLFNNNDTLFEARLGFNYGRLSSGNYDYSVNGPTNRVDGQTLQTAEVGAGFRFVTGIELSKGLLLPELNMMAWHDFKGDFVAVDIEFENSGESFTYYGPKPHKNRYQVGTSMEFLMDNNVTLSGSYDRNWHNGFKSDTWTAKLRYDF